MFDLIIKGGIIVSGDDSDAFKGDIAVSGNSIVVIEPNIEAEAREIIDAEGCIVSPGFIDMHSHSEITLIANPQANSMLMQGVTTEVVGNCGLTPFPLNDDKRRSSLSFIDVSDIEWNWSTADEFLSRLESAKPALNVVQLAGHGGIRAQVMGCENRKADKKDIANMQKLLASMFDDGVAGLSTGLGYAPDFYSDIQELCALAEVVKQYDRIFSFHVRGERATLFKAVAEVIEVARRTGANVQVSHLKCADTMNMGRMKEMLELFDQAEKEGLNVSFDQYPYTAGNSYLGLLFPPWAHEGGMGALLARLDDTQQRKRIEYDMMNGCGNWCSMLDIKKGENILITGIEGRQKQKCEGKMLSEIASEWHMPVEKVACNLMLETKGHAEMVIFQQQEEDLELAMQHHMGMFGSDGFAMDKGERIAKGTPHPRSFGTFPRVFSRYVREKHVITVEQAVYKMTGAPAAKLRLTDRGLLRIGMKADIAIFSPERIHDKATYADPRQYAEGIDWVIVNGAIAKTPNGLTGSCTGRLLRRKDKK